MKVYTESGSCYVFVVSKGKLRTFMGMKEIIVTDIGNLSVGKRMTVRGYDLNIYCQVNSDPFEFTTSPIKSIEP